MSDRSSIDAAWGDLLGDDDDAATPAPLPAPKAPPAVETPATPTSRTPVPDTTEDDIVPPDLPAPPSFDRALQDVLSQIDSDSDLLRIPASAEDMPAGPARFDEGAGVPDAGDDDEDAATSRGVEAKSDAPDADEAEPDADEAEPDADEAEPDADEAPGPFEDPTRPLPPAKDRRTGPRPVVHRSPDPIRSGGLPTWALAAAAVAVVGVAAWWLTRGPADDTPDAPPTKTASAAAVPPSDPSPPEKNVPSQPAPDRDATPASTRTPTPTPTPTPTGEDAPQATSPPSATKPAWMPDPSAAARYDAAKARYDDSGSNEDLSAMVVAACEMDEGPKARAAYRALKGPDTRKQTRTDCGDSPVDLRAEAQDYTPTELVRQAERKLAAGEAKAAMKLARDSNKLQRNNDALELIVRAACADSDAKQARRMLRHVAEADRDEIREACAAAGVTLPADD